MPRCAARASGSSRSRSRRRGGGGRITEKDITLFTRQLATMMKSGVPLLQAFDIVGKGHSNPRVARLLMDIKTDVETGSSLKQAFEKHPLYFDALFCNLIGAGEAAGILDSLLDRLATYKEKILAIKSKIKSALFYPIAIIVVAFVITAVIMIFVIPAFKQVFTNFGADLPGPTLFVMAISDFFVEYWYAHLRRHRRRGLRLLLDLEALGEDADRHGPRDAEAAGVRPSGAHIVHRALDAHARPPCSPPACRWSRRSNRWPAHPATTSITSPPRRSRPRCPPARA